MLQQWCSCVIQQIIRSSPEYQQYSLWCFVNHGNPPILSLEISLIGMLFDHFGRGIMQPDKLAMKLYEAAIFAAWKQNMQYTIGWYKHQGISSISRDLSIGYPRIYLWNLCFIGPPFFSNPLMSLCRECTENQWIPQTNDQQFRKCVHVMMLKRLQF